MPTRDLVSRNVSTTGGGRWPTQPSPSGRRPIKGAAGHSRPPGRQTGSVARAKSAAPRGGPASSDGRCSYCDAPAVGVERVAVRWVRAALTPTAFRFAVSRNHSVLSLAAPMTPPNMTNLRPAARRATRTTSRPGCRQRSRRGSSSGVAISRSGSAHSQFPGGDAPVGRSVFSGGAIMSLGEVRDSELRG